MLPSLLDLQKAQDRLCQNGPCRWLTVDRKRCHWNLKALTMQGEDCPYYDPVPQGVSS